MSGETFELTCYGVAVALAGIGVLVMRFWPRYGECYCGKRFKKTNYYPFPSLVEKQYCSVRCEAKRWAEWVKS